MFSIIYYTAVLITRRIRRRTSVARDRMIVSNRESSSSSPISLNHQFLGSFLIKSSLLNSIPCWFSLKAAACRWFSSSFSPLFSCQLMRRKIWLSKSERVELYVCVHYDQIHVYLVNSYKQLSSLLSVSQSHTIQLGASNVFSIIVCLAIYLDTICIVTLSVVVHRSTRKSTSV